MEKKGSIYKVSGPVVIARNVENPRMYDVVKVGDIGLVGEIIKLDGENIIIQVYEDTSGLRPGEAVENTNRQLSVMLAPGLIGSIFDGIQRPLDKIMEQSGDFIERGIDVSSLDMKKKWHFVPLINNGDEIKAGSIIGEVDETSVIKHKVMVPFGLSGKIEGLKEGDYTITDEIAVVKNDGKKEKISMLQYWPVRVPRPVKEKFSPKIPLITG
ncbi:MAG: V-type ATP synthase subunit A, partial [Candidatus Marsarchaeota archaeon]|nr:V-type ATP synthase subunit A [Candidatus Marsarchaeota archaeon]